MIYGVYTGKLALQELSVTHDRYEDVYAVSIQRVQYCDTNPSADHLPAW